MTLHLELNGWLIPQFKQEARIEDIDNLSLSSETGKPLTFEEWGSFVFGVWMKEKYINLAMWQIAVFTKEDQELEDVEGVSSSPCN